MSTPGDIKDLFNFSRRERNGMFVLLVILLLSILVYYLPKDYLNNPDPDFSEFKNELEIFMAERKSSNEDSTIWTGNIFDPNELTVEEWSSMGLSQKEAATICRYISKGGRFRKKQDLLKMYCIDSTFFSRIEAFISIPQKPSDNFKHFKKKEGTRELFLFDPNSATENDLSDLGLSKTQVKNVLAYRNKGGKFTKKQDMMKIYSINENLYRNLEPFINLPDTLVLMDNLSKPDYSSWSINQLDAGQLASIEGVDKYTANRIIKYRDLLGGYHSERQLLEVYNMDSSTWKAICARIEVDSANITRLSINKLDVDAMARHPYLSKKYAWEIVSFRKKNGDYIKVEELILNYLIPAELFSKIRPYLEV